MEEGGNSSVVSGSQGSPTAGSLSSGTTAGTDLLGDGRDRGSAVGGAGAPEKGAPAAAQQQPATAAGVAVAPDALAAKVLGAGGGGGGGGRGGGGGVSPLSREVGRICLALPCLGFSALV